MKQGEKAAFKSYEKGKSQIIVVHDILRSSQKPLHAKEIILRAKKNFNVDLDRESIVSALSKKVKSGRVFDRVAPNTFTIFGFIKREKDREKMTGLHPYGVALLNVDIWDVYDKEDSSVYTCKTYSWPGCAFGLQSRLQTFMIHTFSIRTGG